MKKINATFVLFSIFFMVSPFAIQVQAQYGAKVTVTIKSLRALSSDACGEMDFFAKINIGGIIKSFPVREGNNLTNLNWQFTRHIPAENVTYFIEIWDDDEVFCGEADDRVNVNGHLNKITIALSTLVAQNFDKRFTGVRTDGNEVAEILFNTTVVPAEPATAPITPLSKKDILAKGIWKIKDIFKKLSIPGMPANPDVPYISTFLLNLVPNCKKDNYYYFTRSGTYQLNEGRTKCATTDPQIIETGTWSFLENETKLQLVKTGSLTPEVFRIQLATSVLNLYKSDYYIHCTH